MNSSTRLVLLKPKMHQLDFRLLICNDLLRQTPQLRILTIQQLGLRHVDGCLMMRNHQLYEINIIISRRPFCHHGRMHCLHTLLKRTPARSGTSILGTPIRALLRQRRRQSGDQNYESENSFPFHRAPRISSFLKASFLPLARKPRYRAFGARCRRTQDRFGSTSSPFIASKPPATIVALVLLNFLQRSMPP